MKRYAMRTAYWVLELLHLFGLHWLAFEWINGNWGPGQWLLRWALRDWPVAPQPHWNERTRGSNPLCCHQFEWDLQTNRLRPIS